MKRILQVLSFLIPLALLISGCGGESAPTPESTDILYFVESFSIDADIYYIQSGYVGSTDGCSNGFSLPRVASDEVIINLANGQIKIDIDDSLTAHIDITPGLVTESEWTTVWHNGVIERDKQLNVTLKNGDESIYHSVANCTLDLMSD